MRIPQNGEGTPDLIAQHGLVVFLELGACRHFGTDDAFDDLFDLGDDFRLRLAQGVLVRDLEQVAQSFGAFSVEAAHGQADLANGFDHRVDLLGEHQSRKMQHDGGAHAGAEIGGAGGEVAELGVKGIGQQAFQLRVHAVHHLKGAGEVQSGADALNAKVILLIDHDGNALLAVHDHSAARGASRMLAADEMALHQNLFADLAKVRVVLAVAVSHFGQLFHHRACALQQLDALAFLAEAWKRVAPEIASKTHPRGHDHVGVRPRAFHPVGGVLDQGGKTHHEITKLDIAKGIRVE